MQTVSIDQLVGAALGDYHVERLLGRGKLSAVYLAQQRSQNRAVMITTFIIPEALSAQARERFNARFLQEGASLVRLSHPNILPIYDFGVQFGYPYLVTSFVKGGSLAQTLKLQPRFTPEQALNILKQIAAGLDFAHSNGVLHGLLNPANILLSDEQVVQVTGFGLRRMLRMRGIEESHHPQAHLFSIGGTFLGAPEYIAPECVQDLPVDARADVYALGIMLFELLSGMLPFTGAEPLDIAMKRLQQPVPSIHGVCPDVSAAFDLIFYQALELEAGKRHKSAGEVARAFERVLKMLDGAANTSSGLNNQRVDTQVTLPPTVNWFDEEIIPNRKWQLMPPVVSGHLPAVKTPSLESATSSTRAFTSTTATGAGPRQLASPQAAGHTESGLAAPSQMTLSAETNNFPGPTNDPFAWWSATSAENTGQVPGTFIRSAAKRPSISARANKHRKASIKGRRQVVLGLLATGGVVGVLGIGGISFARFTQSMKQSQPGTAQSSTSTTPQTHGATPGPKHGTQPTPRPQASPTKTTQPTPRPTPKPTQPPPKPTPTPPPSHTGTVIGHTNQAVNSGKNFTNPADGNGSILIRLPNGHFVSCERACTHVGVPVNYDPGSQKLVCPAHGAVFDPLNGFSLVSGPGNGPLPGVSIRVNADGTITTG